MSVKLNT